MKIAIVTGASSGMGMEFVRQIDHRCLGLDEIWMIARRKKEMEQLKGKAICRLRFFALDLTQDEVYQELQNALKQERPEVRMLVNCAGYGKVGPFTSIQENDNLGMIDLNCRGLTKMTYMVIPYMPQRSYIINLASIAGILPQPNFSIYAASKAFVLSFTKGLRRELEESGIMVSAICPGPVDTEFFNIAEETGTAFGLKKLFFAKKEKVVRQALKKSIRGKEVIVYSLPMKALRLLVKVVPEKIILDIYYRMLRSGE